MHFLVISVAPSSNGSWGGDSAAIGDVLRNKRSDGIVFADVARSAAARAVARITFSLAMVKKMIRGGGGVLQS